MVASEASGFVSQNFLESLSHVYFLKRPQLWKVSVLKGLFGSERVKVIDEKDPFFPLPNSGLVVWGTKEYSLEQVKFLHHWRPHLPVFRMEDGFVRSVGQGAAGVSPYTIVFDDLGIYFDPTTQSRLEQMIESLQISSGLILRAKRNIEFLIENGLSKTNFELPISPLELYGKKQKRRILVVGQCQSDESIRRGVLGKVISCEELVKVAYDENPDAEIYYRAHPDVRMGFRSGYNPSEIDKICKVIPPCSLSSSLATIDKVYTITSLAGFEALLRNIPVACFGTPFYSGWGLTEDRDTPCLRRTKRRTVEELFAISYLLYPDYFDCETFERITLEEVTRRLLWGHNSLRVTSFNSASLLPH